MNSCRVTFAIINTQYVKYHIPILMDARPQKYLTITTCFHVSKIYQNILDKDNQNCTRNPL